MSSGSSAVIPRSLPLLRTPQPRNPIDFHPCRNKSVENAEVPIVMVSFTVWATPVLMPAAE